jgi:thiosulfate/3-mercaptopyruvate sulfurtransferase
MNNRQLAAAMEEPGTVVLDARPVGQYLGLQKHPLQLQTGHIDRTVKGFLKDPKAIAWLLESSRITKDKKIIVTCNTGQQAAGTWFALKYLSYPNVIMHDGSWVSWERSPMMKK